MTERKALGGNGFRLSVALLAAFLVTLCFGAYGGLVLLVLAFIAREVRS